MPGKEGEKGRISFNVVGGLAPDGRVTYCNGGHRPPFVVGSGGVRRLEEGGPVIGLLEFAPFSEEVVTLEREPDALPY